MFAQIWNGDKPIMCGMWRSQCSLWISDILLCFESTGCQRPKFEISDPPLKTGGGVAELSGSEESSIMVTQGESIRFPTSSFVHASKVTVFLLYYTKLKNLSRSN